MMPPGAEWQGGVMTGPLAASNGLPCLGISVDVMTVCHAGLHFSTHLADDAREGLDAAHMFDLSGRWLVLHAATRRRLIR